MTYGALYGYVRAKMGADTSIEDILQETYFEAYKKREKLKSHPKPVGWLFKTADFMIKNWKRRKDNQIESLEMLSNMPDKLYVYGEYEKIEWKLTLQEILSEKEGELVRLYYQERYSSAEIAVLYGMTEGCVRVRLCRIRRKIKENCGETTGRKRRSLTIRAKENRNENIKNSAARHNKK